MALKLAIVYSAAPTALVSRVRPKRAIGSRTEAILGQKTNDRKARGDIAGGESEGKVPRTQAYEFVGQEMYHIR